MKANVDKDTCIGCGACPSICLNELNTSFKTGFNLHHH